MCKGQQQHEEVCLGLFTLVLTEPTQAQRVRHHCISVNVLHRCVITVTSPCDHCVYVGGQCYRDLTLVNRDGMNVVLVKINQILMEKFLKLQDVPRTQVNKLTHTCIHTGIQVHTGIHTGTVVFSIAPRCSHTLLYVYFNQKRHCDPATESLWPEQNHAIGA